MTGALTKKLLSENASTRRRDHDTGQVSSSRAIEPQVIMVLDCQSPRPLVNGRDRYHLQTVPPCPPAEMP